MRGSKYFREEQFVLTIIVIGLNETGNLHRCFTSINNAIEEAKNWLNKTEVYYVDSGSSDPSVQIARSYAKRVFQLCSAPSAAAARTVGLAEARGDFVLFLDGDMELRTEFLPAAFSLLQSEANNNIAGVIGIRDDIIIDEKSGEKIAEVSNVYRIHNIRRAQHFGGALLAKRSAILRSGGFRPELKASEEPDMYARLLACGDYVLEMPVPFVRHFTAPRQPIGKKLRKLLAFDGPSYFFGLSFGYALKGRYLGKFAQVFKSTFTVWIVDALSLSVVFLGWPRTALLVQICLFLWLMGKRKIRLFITARMRFYGVILALIKLVIARRYCTATTPRDGLDYKEI